MTTQQEFHDSLRTLSEASVEQNFDAFKDIDWDHPDYAVDPTTHAGCCRASDVLGAHEWYLGLPEDEQIGIGLYRQANVTKVGLAVREVLISGVMKYLRRRCPTAPRSSATPPTR